MEIQSDSTIKSVGRMGYRSWEMIGNQKDLVGIYLGLPEGSIAYRWPINRSMKLVWII